MQGWTPQPFRKVQAGHPPPPDCRRGLGITACSSQHRPQGRTWLGLAAIGSAAVPSTSYPCTRTSYTHATHPHTPAHTRTPCPAPQGEMWKGLRAAPTDSCGRMRFRDEDAEEGCGSRRFAAAAGAERGRGRAPDRGCCCQGDAGWGRGARACCPPAPSPTRTPIRAAPGPQSLTPAQTLTHSSRRGTHLASGARFLRPGVSEALGQDLSGRADFPSCPLGRLGRGPLGSAPAHPEEGLLVFQSVSSWPVTFPWVSPSFSHCAPAQCPAWRRCSVGAQGVSE